ncbi:MAG TPA: hypothetical protein HA224_03870 [Nanoarchaeota archaeon]|nr:hypothetical protein [Nanoarchaeota archaeon]
MVSKWPLLLILIITAPLLFASANATDLILTNKVITNEVNYDGRAKYTVSVTNTQDIADDICLTTPTWGMAVLSDNIITMPAHSTSAISVTMTPPMDVYIGQYAIELTAKSCKDPTVAGTTLMKISVMTELPHIEPSVDLPIGLRPHEYTMNLIAKNVGSEKVGNLRGTVSSDLFDTQSFDIGEIPAQEAKVALQSKVNIWPTSEVGIHNIIINIYQGEKLIKSSIKRVQILGSEQVTADTIVKQGIFGKSYVIKLTNTGNLAVDDSYFVKLPTWTRLFISTSPKAISSKAYGGYEISWHYSLKPAESLIVKYTFSYVPLFIILIILCALGYVFYTQGAKEITARKSVIKDGKDLKVKIAIKNTGQRQITNVTLADLIPAPLKLVKSFGTANPTIIKREHGGAKVIWKFDVIYPNEERVLVYSLKSTLGFVGEAVLPSAEVKYKAKAGQQVINYSNTASVKGKVSVSD